MSADIIQTPPINEEYISSSDDETYDEREEAERPMKLREKANEFFKQGQYQKANEIWLQSVKESLKRSVRYPSAQIYENQVICRLNLAMGYLKIGEWVEAKEQASLVLEQRPHNVKALYRLAQALEELQDWEPCEKTLSKLLQEVQNYRLYHQTCSKSHDVSTVQSYDNDEDYYKKLKEENKKENDDKSDILEYVPDLHGFKPEEIEHLVSQIRYRIAKAKSVYVKKSKKLFQGIGQKLNRVGVSDNRDVDVSEKDPHHRDPLGVEQNLTAEQMGQELIGTELDNIIQWRYKLTNEDQLCSSQEDTVKETGVSLQQKDDKACMQERTEKYLGDTMTPIIKDSIEGDRSTDDPSSLLWTTHYDVISLKNDKRPLVLSLPLTLTRIVDLCLQKRKLDTDELIQNQEEKRLPFSSKDSAHPKLFTSIEAEDNTPLGILRRKILWSVCRRRELTVHVIGARGDVEMESQWTAILKRIPKLRHLNIFFIGFLDKDDRWSKSLREGILSPPLVKSQGLLPFQKLTCRLYKGMYQTFVNEHPGVLLSGETKHKPHLFHPDIVFVPEPRLSLYFDAWAPVFQQLLNNSIPTVVTGYSAKDFATHDARCFSPVIRALGGEWAIPLHSNPFSIKIKPEPECPAMTLWAPEDEERIEFKGISAKHAVVGCFVNFIKHQNTTQSCQDEEEQLEWMSDYQIREIKKTLKSVCDVEEEARVLQENYQKQCKDQQNEASENKKESNDEMIKSNIISPLTASNNDDDNKNNDDDNKNNDDENKNNDDDFSTGVKYNGMKLRND